MLFRTKELALLLPLLAVSEGVLYYVYRIQVFCSSGMKNDSFRLPFLKKVTNSVSADYHPACGFKNPAEIYSYFLEDSAFPSKHPPPPPHAKLICTVSECKKDEKVCSSRWSGNSCSVKNTFWDV